MTPLHLLRPDGEAAQYPIVDGDSKYSWDALMARAGGVAAELSAGERPLSRGGRCIVSLDKGPDFFAGLVGCWMAGQLPVLLDPMVRTELRAAVEMTGAGAAVLTSDRAAQLPANVNAVAPAGACATPRPLDAPAPDGPVLFLFTSGSTGRPTLVPKRIEQLAVEVDFISRLFNYPKRVAGLIPWCHIWGLLASFFVPLKMGGVCDLRGGISARGVLELVAEGALDLVVGVPVYYRAMVTLMKAGVIVVPQGASCFASSSAPLTPAVRRDFRRYSGCGITDIYGSTEAGGIAYRHEEGPWIPEPHVEIRVDSDGMLAVRSPSVSFETEDGLFSTGDLVRPEEAGFILLGRGDDVVKIGGRRIALGEIRSAIESMQGVAKAAVVTEQVSGALRLIAFVEASEQSLNAREVKTFVRQKLADHKVPREIHFLAELPMTSSGKLDRQRLVSLLRGKENR